MHHLTDTPAKQPVLSFVDLHSHVLPGVDDGPQTWDEAMAMVRSAASSGTALMAATPHGDRRGTWHQVDSLKGLCQDLNRELEHVPLTVVLGMENPLELDTAEQIERGTALTLNGSAYTLIELPFLQLPLYWEDVLFELQLRGLRPIIAHPERQIQIQENPDILAGVVDRGMLTQVTAGSLVGHFGPRVRRTAHRLMKKGLVHAIASDCHGPHGPRGPDLLEGFQAASKLVGRELAAQMVWETPWAIAQGNGNGDLRQGVSQIRSERMRRSTGEERNDSR